MQLEFCFKDIFIYILRMFLKVSLMTKTLKSTITDT